MKFYYEGKLIRTSKNHVYTHAVINTQNGALIGCRSNEEGAKAVISSAIGSHQNQIKDDENAITALKAGRSYYTTKVGRRSVPLKFGRDVSKNIDDWMGYIKGHKEAIDYIKENWKVVELQAG